MLRALVQVGIRPDLVVGASVGALNGAHFAGRPDAEGVEALAGLWSTIRRPDVFPFRPRSLVGGITGRQSHIVDPQGLRSLLKRATTHYRQIEEAAIELHVVATDTGHGGAVVLSEGNVVEALMASAALPGIYPPVEIDGRSLIDGGVAANIPVAQAAYLGASTIYVLSTVPPMGALPARTAADMVLRAMVLATAPIVAADMAEASRMADVRILPLPDAGARSMFDFGTTRQLIDRSYRTALEWAEGLVAATGTRAAGAGATGS